MRTRKVDSDHLATTKIRRCYGGIMKAPKQLDTGWCVRYEGLTKEWLEYEYITEDKSLRQIAEEVGATLKTIHLWTQKFGLVKPKAHIHQQHSERMTGRGNPAWNGGTARNYQARLLKRSDKLRRCIWCGATKKLQVHHMDHDRLNGDLDNLEWLCGPCNRMESQMHALECVGRATVKRTDNQLILTFTEV